MAIFSGGSSSGTNGPKHGIKLLPLLAFGIYFLFYYFSNQETVPLTGRKQIVDITPSEEISLGLQSYQQVLANSEVVQGGSEVSLVRSVGEKIAHVSENSTFDWEFNVLKSSDANAFCLPGGKVAIYSGIFPFTKNPDGLAVVMGHEIAHALARHGAERMAHERLAQFGQVAVGLAVSDMDNDKRRVVLGAFGLGAQYGILLPFSRSHESEADRMGLILMSRACFNPEEAPKFWERMNAVNRNGNPPEFVSTHPKDERRIAQLKAWIPEALAERSKFCP